MNLRDNYFLKLIKYINNVYHLDKQIEYITDKRLNPTYRTGNYFIKLIKHIKNVYHIGMQIKYLTDIRSNSAYKT